ncbi:hypothetical protein, partial [Cellvibrio sp.]
MMTIFLRLLVSITLSVAVATISYANDTPKYYEATDTIVILGAVPQEIPVLTEALENPEKKSLWGIPYWQGKLHGKPVIIAITG